MDTEMREDRIIALFESLEQFWGVILPGVTVEFFDWSTSVKMEFLSAASIEPGFWYESLVEEIGEDLKSKFDERLGRLNLIIDQNEPLLSDLFKVATEESAETRERINQSLRTISGTLADLEIVLGERDPNYADLGWDKVVRAIQEIGNEIAFRNLTFEQLNRFNHIKHRLLRRAAELKSLGILLTSVKEDHPKDSKKVDSLNQAGWRTLTQKMRITEIDKWFSWLESFWGEFVPDVLENHDEWTEEEMSIFREEASRPYLFYASIAANLGHDLEPRYAERLNNLNGLISRHEEALRAYLKNDLDGYRQRSQGFDFLLLKVTGFLNAIEKHTSAWNREEMTALKWEELISTVEKIEEMHISREQDLSFEKIKNRIIRYTIENHPLGFVNPLVKAGRWIGGREARYDLKRYLEDGYFHDSEVEALFESLEEFWSETVPAATAECCDWSPEDLRQFCGEVLLDPPDDGYRELMNLLGKDIRPEFEKRFRKLNKLIKKKEPILVEILKKSGFCSGEENCDCLRCQAKHNIRWEDGKPAPDGNL